MTESLNAPVLADVALPIPIPVAIVLFIAGLVGYALVNAIEIAVVATSRARAKAEAEEGSRRGAAVERLKSQQDAFFGAIVILQNVFVFLLSTMGTVIAVEAFPGYWGFLFGLIAIPLISTEFGEYSPKVLASRAADRLAFAVAIPMELLVLIMRPMTRALSIVPNIFGAPGTPRTVTEAELRMLIDIGAEEGAVGEEEAELLDRVFHFHDRRVNEIMIPRTEVVWLEKQETLREFLDTFHEAPHSRFPVYDDSVDNVVGIISIKDVLRGLAERTVSEESGIESMIRPAMFIPETKLVSDLFWEMQDERRQMAVVVDEYGGVAGVVTLELLLEEMVGRVVDELGQASEEFSVIDKDTTRVDGGMSIFDIREELELDIPEGDYETIAGYVLERLGHIPREGESVTLNSYRITVSDVKGRKIESVVLTRLPGA